MDVISGGGSHNESHIDNDQASYRRSGFSRFPLDNLVCNTVYDLAIENKHDLELRETQ
jgi:hypothetical protein